MLEVEKLSVYNAAGLPILRDVTFQLNECEIMSILGVNGSGKTELAMAIMGHNHYDADKILFNNKNIKGLKPYNIANLGLCMVSEERHLFSNLTVETHLELGTLVKSMNQTKQHIKNLLDKVYGIFPRLYERRHQNANTLSGGEQQMLCVGRSLMSEPTCLILDEPTQGLSVQLAKDLIQKTAQLKEEGLSIILIEQNVNLALEISDKVLSIDHQSIDFFWDISFYKNKKIYSPL